METKKLQALYDLLNTSQDPNTQEQLLAQFKLERPDFKPKIDAKQFLQYVAYGQQDEADDLLTKDNKWAQELLTARDIPFTDYSGRTFECSAYEYAYWAKDTHMCRMLEKHMSDHTKQELLKWVGKIKQSTDLTFIKKPNGLVYTDKNGKEQCSANFDLVPLIKTLEDYITAFDKIPNKTDEDFAALGALWLKVGMLQRDVPAHIAQEYCHPNRLWYKVSRNPALLDASNPKNLKRTLKFHNCVTNSSDEWFTPSSFSTDSGLGYSFTIAGSPLAGRNFGFGEPLMTDLAGLKAIEKARTDDLKQSLINLESPSNQQAVPSLGG